VSIVFCAQVVDRGEICLTRAWGFTTIDCCAATGYFSVKVPY
jgi:hypothetical protein